MQRIGLMGGSFNPIHLGHVNMARAALEGGMVDRVLLLPTGNPPHKREGLADKTDRLAMVHLAIEGEAGMAVCTEELERGGVIYTVDTLTILRSRMPDCRFCYLIGADTLRVLHTWRRIEDVIRLCSFLVVMRPGEDEADALSAAESWRARGAEILFLPAKRMDVSSTEIRLRLARGESLAGLVSAPVEGYIRKHGLYGSEDDMKREKMAYKLKKELDKARYEHTLGVEQTAREMARIFGADEDKAALAGLLHDCAKCMPLDKMVKAAKREHVDPMMKESKALMHAVAGRCVAADVYNVEDEDVLSAIRWHTTGRAGMTDLEKIIYLADMIEPNRKPFEGIEALRALCRTDLDAAMHKALRGSLDYVLAQGKTLHPDTLAALADYEEIDPTIGS